MPPSQPLVHGPLPKRTVHLCVDMQRLFDAGAPWSTPWLPRVLPRVRTMAQARAAQTIFTRFIPPQQPNERPGAWRRYYERWREVTREHADPALLELLPPLAALVPPATVIDKAFYSPFHESPLLGLLRRRRTEALVISGAETDVCVLAAVLDAVDLGFRVVLARDALCSSSDRTHDALMTLYHNRFSQQIEVADTEVVLQAWDDA